MKSFTFFENNILYDITNNHIIFFLWNIEFNAPKEHKREIFIELSKCKFVHKNYRVKEKKRSFLFLCIFTYTDDWLY